MILRLVQALSAAIFVAAATPSGADAFESLGPPRAVAEIDGISAVRLAKETERTLAARGARVALVFRTGRSKAELPPGIEYTHGAFWVYQTFETVEGQKHGYAVYNLYHGDGRTQPRSRSSLVQDFPLDFAMGARGDDIAVVIPTPEVQARLLRVIGSPIYEALHIPAYSSISNASDPSYQNCNEFMLDVLAAAIWETDDYAQIKANLAHSFEGTLIGASPLKRLFGPLTDDRLTLADHGKKIRTVTYGSLKGFMEQNGYVAESFTIAREVTEAN